MTPAVVVLIVAALAFAVSVALKAADNRRTRFANQTKQEDSP